MEDEFDRPEIGRYYYLKYLELERVISVLECRLELYEKDLNEEEKEWRRNWIKSMSC